MLLLVVSRAHRCLSATFRESADGTRGLLARLLERVGARRLRKAPDQMFELPAPGLDSGDRPFDPLAPLGQGLKRAALRDGSLSDAFGRVLPVPRH